MTFSQLEQYAQQHGWDSLRFSFVSHKGDTLTGRWLDAYMGVFRLDQQEEGYMILSHQWKRLYRDDEFNFQVIQ